MKISVIGLWHLGTVTAACLASVDNIVIGYDDNVEIIQQLINGKNPIFEPGLDDLVKVGLERGNLLFTSDIEHALKDAEIIWITYDTPVDEDDHADVEFIKNKIKLLFPHIQSGTTIIISSQVIVGTTHEIENEYKNSFSRSDVSFIYSPENLRLGKAIQTFLHPDRIVVGVRSDNDKAQLTDLLRPFTDHIEWMSVESAEITKHSLNAFLATSVTLINEIATLCEQVGADAKEVERGLKSESRIGPKAYLSPGAAFAGGTLARDVDYLNQIGDKYHQAHHLLSGVKKSNDAHKLWVQQKITQNLKKIGGQTVAVWGLTYKPGTDTLRRSIAVELCVWLHEQGANIQAFDPVIKKMPVELSFVKLYSSPLEAVNGAAVLVIATEWEVFQKISSEQIKINQTGLLVLDANRFLNDIFDKRSDIRYISVGKVNP